MTHQIGIESSFRAQKPLTATKNNVFDFVFSDSWFCKGITFHERIGESSANGECFVCLVVVGQIIYDVRVVEFAI